MARAHAIAAIIEDTTGQQGLGLTPCTLMIVDLLVELGLHRIEQSLFENGGLLALEDLTFESDLADIETIAKQLRERSPSKGNAPYSVAALQCADLSHDATLAQVCQHQIEAAKPEITIEDGSDSLRFGFIYGDLA